ncbi:MAG: hypothetical protein RLO51_16805 [Thalassobaculum sp.]|uniref:hypothetical protein n=1 Tax=Thalassobaculum sp. TaxID=2022740 RepID=UPI0032EE7102
MKAEAAALRALLAEIEAGRVRLDPAALTVAAVLLADLLAGKSVCIREGQPRLVRRRRVLADLAAAFGCEGNPAAAADRIRGAIHDIVAGEGETTEEIAADLARLIELSKGRVPSRTTIYADLTRTHR